MGGGGAVPLIRLEVLRPMVDLLGEGGAPVGGLLRGCGLPGSVEGQNAGIAPARAVFDFVERAAASQGLSDLCWGAVTRRPFSSLGAWGRPLARERTLRDAIRRFCLLLMGEISYVRVGLEHGETCARLWRARPPPMRSWHGDSQGEQFVLGWMLRVVQLAAGPAWVPPCIALEKRDTEWIQGQPSLSSCRVELDAGVTAIDVPRELLDRPIRPPASANDIDDSPARTAALAETLSGSLRQVIPTLLPSRKPTIELGAELADLSSRTLKRRLSEEGTSWRQTVDRARYEACERMLRDADLSLTEIAAELGYSDQAHLTRAFRRWAGESPSAHRRRCSGLHRPDRATQDGDRTGR